MNNKFIIITILSLMLFCINIVSAETDISVLDRLNNLGGSDSDIFYSVIDSGDYYIAVGRSDSDLSNLTGGNSSAGNHFVIAKFLKSNLSLINVNNFGGSNLDSFNSVIDSGDYYIAVGYSDSDLSNLTGGDSSAGDYDFVIAKFLKSNLSLINVNNFGGSNRDSFYSVVDSGDYYIAVGRSSSNLIGLAGGANTTGGDDFVIAKFLKSDLSLVSLNNLGGSGSDFFHSVIDSGDYYIAAGYSYSDLSSIGGNSVAGSGDFVITKFLKSDLSLVSLNNLGGSDYDVFNSVIDSGDYYVAVGYSRSDLSSFTGGTNTSGGYDFVITKFLKSDLSLVSLNNLGGSGSDYFHSVVESGDYYIAVGYSGSDLSNLTGGANTSGNPDFVITKFLKSNLSLINVNNLGGSNYDVFHSVIDSGDYYIAAGYSSSDLSNLTGSDTSGNADFVITKFGEEGDSSPIYSNFDGDTTNFSEETNLSNVENLTIEITGKGKINFGQYSINTSSTDFNTHINIENSIIFVNTSALDTTFNNSATLTFEGVNCNYPYVYYSATTSTRVAILAENTLCPSSICSNIQCTDSTLTVDVTHFSGYAVNGTANLTIDADDPKYTEQLVTFTAEYRNATGLITGATCTISLPDGDHAMNELASNIYNYSTTYVTAQTIDYNVTCSKTGENTVFANDTAIINAVDIPEFSAITLGLGLIAVLAGLFIIRKKK
ncbi:MAG: hypothetical protein U9R34_08585 [Nanoarchaeota archaeon]|nr:hypothetical protein [Nanoarchaeota archaeon]